jgi:hypothetical protein
MGVSMTMKEKKSGQKRFFWVAGLVILFVLVGVIKGLSGTLPANAAAVAASVSDDQVEVSLQPTILALVPKRVPLQCGMIFYPGARVSVQAYVPLLKPLAEAGILVVIPKMPLGFAVLDINRAADIETAYPQVTCWVIGGHSLGGSMAAEFAADYADQLDGIVFVASYPAKNTSLHELALQGLVIRGTLDGLVTQEDIDAVAGNFPLETRFLNLEGGNHAQFGDYGVQRGDGQATIAPMAQQLAASQAMLEFFALLDRNCMEK